MLVLRIFNRSPLGSNTAAVALRQMSLSDGMAQDKGRWGKWNKSIIPLFQEISFSSLLAKRRIYVISHFTRNNADKIVSPNGPISLVTAAAGNNPNAGIKTRTNDQPSSRLDCHFGWLYCLLAATVVEEFSVLVTGIMPFL